MAGGNFTTNLSGSNLKLNVKGYKLRNNNIDLSLQNVTNSYEAIDYSNTDLDVSLTFKQDNNVDTNNEIGAEFNSSIGEVSVVSSDIISWFQDAIDNLKNAVNDIVSSFSSILDSNKSVIEEDAIDTSTGFSSILKTNKSVISLFNKAGITNISEEDIDSIESSDKHKYIVKLKNGYIYHFDDNSLVGFYDTNKDYYNINEDGKLECFLFDENTFDIFSNKNIETNQYGGSQMSFQYNNEELLRNSDIRKILERNFPDATEEDYSLLLYKVCNIGCGYTAIVNTIFEAFEGNQREFENCFGIDMFRINSSGEVVYNYEPLILDVFTWYWHDKKGLSINEIYGDITSDVDDGAVSIITSGGATGPTSSAVADIYKYLSNNYDLNITMTMGKMEANAGTDKWNEIAERLRNQGIDVDEHSDPVLFYNDPPSIERINMYLSQGKSIMVTDSSFDMYEYNSEKNLAGEIINENVGPHVMSLVGLTSDNNVIVSSWGKQYVISYAGIDEWYIVSSS